MALQMKFGQCVPFPTKPGVYNRYVFANSPDKPDAVVIVQGQVMLFQDEKVTVLDQGAETTAEVVAKGDEMNRAEKLTVAYVRVEGAGIRRDNNPLANGQGKDREVKNIKLDE